MPITAQFAKTARSVVSRITELLRTQVLIVDRQGTIVASSEASQVGLPFKLLEGAAYPLKLPLQVDNQCGQVVVSATGGEVISQRLAQVLVELVINQATVLDRLPNRQALKDQFIAHLLQGQTTDEADVLHQAKLLGLNLIPPRAVILIDAAEYILMPDKPSSRQDKRSLADSSRSAFISATSERLSDSNRDDVESAEVRQRRRAQLIIGSVVNFFHLPDDTICADLGAGKVAILKASDTKNMGKWAKDRLSEPSISDWANLTALKRASDALLLRLRSDTGTAISIGIGRYHPGIKGLSLSYQDARAAIALGRRFIGHNQVYCLDRLGIAAFVCVTNEQTKIELATYLLSPLDSEPELLATLEAFFAQDCCPSATAKQLSIHRNTLAYRLNKISSLTGLNPRRFDDAVQIHLALLLRSLKPTFM